jgi:citrate synthase
MAGGKSGLREVVAASTAISAIDGKRGKLWYAGYPIEELVAHSTFEEVTFLLHHRRLPSADELDALSEQMAEAREVPFMTDLLPALAEHSSPMAMLRSCVSLASAHDPDGWDHSAAANYRKAIRIISFMPTMVAAFDRHRRGVEPVEPNPKLPHAANFLHMLLGEEPSQESARALDQALVMYADHTMNASTFCARVVASTLSDIHSAIVAAIAALKGPLHGGANEGAMRLLEEIGEPARAERHVADLLARKARIMGFGHPVYRTEDPRATILRELSRTLAAQNGEMTWFDISQAVDRAVREQKGLYPNVDFFMASVLRYMGIATDLFTPVFAIGRTAGWTAHVREQLADNRIIRPESEYVGAADRPYVPMEEREAEPDGQQEAAAS